MAASACSATLVRRGIACSWWRACATRGRSARRCLTPVAGRPGRSEVRRQLRGPDDVRGRCRCPGTLPRPHAARRRRDPCRSRHRARRGLRVRVTTNEDQEPAGYEVMIGTRVVERKLLPAGRRFAPRGQGHSTRHWSPPTGSLHSPFFPVWRRPPVGRESARCPLSAAPRVGGGIAAARSWSATSPSRVPGAAAMVTSTGSRAPGSDHRQPHLHRDRPPPGSVMLGRGGR